MDRPIQRVLIIEADVLFQAFLQDALSAAGYATRGCETLAAARHLVSSALFDLVLLDLHLDGPESGLELLAWLRQEWAIATTPVIICSAGIRPLHAQAQHCFAAIEQPCDRAELLATVDAALGLTPLHQRSHEV